MRVSGAAVAIAACVMALSACGEKKKAPPIAKHDVVADSADQIMYGVKLYMTVDGVNRAQVMGDTAYFFNDNSRVRLLHVHATFYTNMGEVNSTLTSHTGQFDTNTQSMQARGDVNVTSVDGRVLRTEELKYDKYRNQISSDSAFVLTEPDRRLQGVGFRSDPNLQNVRVLRVESGTAGDVTVPNP
jgi:LPS export ABC transporter protein LptC